MKRLLLIIILTLNFQSWTKADDIRDFEIGGMSIGDSLLDYLSKSEINEVIKLSKNDYRYLKDPTKYREAYIFQPNDFKTYQYASLMFKQNDDNYTIMFLRGMKDYIENLNGCFSQLNEIAQELEKKISNFTKDVREAKSKLDKTGKSKTYNTYYTLSSGDAIMLVCNNWDEKLRKENNWTEGLSVIVRTEEVGNWLQGN